MARKSRTERWKEVHAAALEEFDQIWTETYDERKQCNEDRRFVVVRGAQWEGLSDQFEDRPMFELNKVAASCMRIENEYRNSQSAAESGAAPEVTAYLPGEGETQDPISDYIDVESGSAYDGVRIKDVLQESR